MRTNSSYYDAEHAEHTAYAHPIQINHLRTRSPLLTRSTSSKEPSGFRQLIRKHAIATTAATTTTTAAAAAK